MALQSTRRGARIAPLGAVLSICLILPQASFADSPPRPSPEAEPSAAKDETGQPALKPGDAVHLETTLPGGRIKGRIESIDDEQVTVVDKEGEKLSLPWSSVNRLDLQVGLRRKYGTSVLIGGGIGLGLGLLLPLPKPEHYYKCLGESCSDPLWSREQQVVLGASVTALIFLISEAVSKPKYPKWERIHLPYHPPAVTSFGFGATPGKGGAAFRVAFAF